MGSIEREDIASFYFLRDLPKYQTEKPYEIWRESDPSIPKSNCEFEEHHSIVVNDMRSSEVNFDYESTGFKVLNAPPKYPLRGEDCTIVDPNPGVQSYLEETIGLVREQFNTEKVICFDWRYRKSTGIKQVNVYDHTKPERFHALNPAHVVHSDDSPSGGDSRLRRYLSQEEEKDYDAGKWRVRFVNVWRPLIPVVEESPLAFCDRRSVAKEDMVECDKIHEDHIGEGLYVKYQPHHRWYWLSDQTSDEASVFITWDSRQDPQFPAGFVCSDSLRPMVQAAGPPHAAFDDPRTRNDSELRESIEVRLIVISDTADA